MHKNQPLVSVMMPIYNGEKTLPLALASLKAQTYTNWKAIIVNDGSTDGTKEFLNALDDPRFKIIHFEKNKGRPYARQAALDAAEGKYLAFLDADDFYHPEKLEKQVKVMEENPEVDLVSCVMASYGKDFRLQAIRPKRELKDFYKVDQPFRPARAPSIIKLLKAKQIKYNMELKYAQDTDFFSRYLNNGKYIITSDILYYYSEFVSVTGKKILKTYYFSFIGTFERVNANSFSSIIPLFTIGMKFLLTLIGIPILGRNYFLKQRGTPPSETDIQEFNHTLKQIRQDH